MASPPSSENEQPSEHDLASVYRGLPSVDQLTAADGIRNVDEMSPQVVTRLAQMELDRARLAIKSGERPTRFMIEERVETALRQLGRPRLTPGINATGVLIHTNLGRAPVSDATAEAMANVAANPVPLELEPATNERGSRMAEISMLMNLLIGAESTLVVNNCAAGLLLSLSAIAKGRDVIVSRGEEVEIGGGFRIPDVMIQSGARLVEVGTTNRTYIRDYADATGETTAAYLKVHPSNYWSQGFVHSVNTSDLATLGQKKAIPVIEDLGSGAMIETAAFGLPHEPTIQESVASGAAIVLFSGDKLIGGPQAGFIVGKSSIISRIERHPLARAVRADKTCLAGVAATLRHFARDEALTHIPVWQMISATTESLYDRAQVIVRLLEQQKVTSSVEATTTPVGGGSVAGGGLPSYAIAIPLSEHHDLARCLRLGQPAVFGRTERNRVLIDLRTVLPRDDQRLAKALAGAMADVPDDGE